MTLDGAGLPLGSLLLALTGALAVGLSKGGLPMIGMLSVPLLAQVMAPVKAAALLLPVFILSDVVGVWLYRREFSRVDLRILIPAALAGVLLGWALAARVSDRAFAMLVGLLGIGFCLNVWFGGRLRRGSVGAPAARPPSWTRGGFWGIVLGFTSFVAHAGAPPLQIYLLPRRLPKLVFAGTSTLLFAVVNLAKLPPYMLLQPYTRQDLLAIAWMAPAALAGTWLGAWATRRIDERWFFRLVQAGLFAVSLKLVADAVRGPGG